MELKFKFKILLIISVIFSLLIVINWYSDLDYTKKYNDKVEEELDAQKMINIDSSYRWYDNRRYFKSYEVSIKETKSNIPLIFKRDTLSATQAKIVSYSKE